MGIDRSVIRPTAVQGLFIPAEVLQAAMALKGEYVPIVRNCIACANFAELACPASSAGPEHNDAYCKKMNSYPPARVIAYGCPMYENDDVPF